MKEEKTDSRGEAGLGQIKTFVLVNTHIFLVHGNRLRLIKRGSMLMSQHGKSHLTMVVRP